MRRGGEGKEIRVKRPVDDLSMIGEECGTRKEERGGMGCFRRNLL